MKAILIVLACLVPSIVAAKPFMLVCTPDAATVKELLSDHQLVITLEFRVDLNKKTIVEISGALPIRALSH